jgi:hypothetical protein
MEPSTSLIPYLKSSSLIVFGIVHVANVAQPIINSAFIKCFYLYVFLFKYNDSFCGGQVIFEKMMENVYTDKGGDGGKAGIVDIYH